MRSHQKCQSQDGSVEKGSIIYEEIGNCVSRSGIMYNSCMLSEWEVLQITTTRVKQKAKICRFIFSTTYLSHILKHRFNILANLHFKFLCAFGN